MPSYDNSLLSKKKKWNGSLIHQLSQSWTNFDQAAWSETIDPKTIFNINLVQWKKNPSRILEGKGTSKWKGSYALSFHGSKTILDRPNNFDRVLIVLDRSNSFWLGPNHFGLVQFINLVQKSVIGTRPKWFRSNQNNSDPTKTICTRPKQFGWSKIILDL